MMGFDYRNLKAEDKISVTKTIILKKSPFFSYLTEHLNYIEKDIGTCGVDVKGNFYYDSKFVNRISKQELIGVVLHETLHLALSHPARGKGKNLYVNGISLWNIAIDIIVNNIITMNFEGVAELPKEGIIPHNDRIDIFGVTVEDISKKSADEIYYELAEKLKEKYGETQEYMMNEGEGNEDEENKGNSNSNSEGNNNSKDKKEEKEGNGTDEDKNKERKVKGWNGVNDKNSKRFDKHVWDRNKDNKPTGKGNKDWQKIMSEAMTIAKQRGENPLGIEREWGEVKRGKINWRSVIRNTIRGQIPSDMTWMSPNRKYVGYGIYLPSVKRESADVVIAIDTSGSMSQEEFSEILGEIIHMSRSFEYINMRLITHDVDVHDDYEIRNGNIAKIKKLKIHGGGGTSHIPLYKYIEEKYPRTKLLISFTDGYSAFPEKSHIPTVFVLTGDSHTAKGSMPSWAMKVLSTH